MLKCNNVSTNWMFPFLQLFFLSLVVFLLFRRLHVSFSCGFSQAETAKPKCRCSTWHAEVLTCRTDKDSEDRSSPFIRIYFFFSAVSHFVAQTYGPREDIPARDEDSWRLNDVGMKIQHTDVIQCVQSLVLKTHFRLRLFFLSCSVWYLNIFC